MTKKCTKFEGLFIFADKETLQKHIETCEDCRKEQEKFERVSELLQEVKPLYKKKTTPLKTSLKIACALAVVLFGTSAFNTLDERFAFVDTLRYGQAISLEELGFPVDSYGLLMVE